MKTTQTTAYIARSSARLNTPNRLPRGTAWMPSSPPVNFACSEKKNAIWASARVIIEK